MKTFTRIEIVLTTLVVISVVGESCTALWFHSMSMSDPVRRLWQQRFDLVGPVLWFGAIIPWFLFTVFYVIAVVGQRRGARGKV
jgi:hypothetical protein